MEKELKVALSKFKSAVKLMNTKARGKYNCVSLELTTYGSREVKLECKVYKEGVGWGNGPTWEEAFQNQIDQL